MKLDFMRMEWALGLGSWIRVNLGIPLGLSEVVVILWFFRPERDR